MKYPSFLPSFLMATTCLFNASYLKADTDLIKEDFELLDIRKSGRSKFIETKTKNAAESRRLSNKGDFPLIDNLGQTVYGLPQLRPYYTRGEGDCFFEAIGMLGQNAVDQWLHNAANANIRQIASEEIYDEFVKGSLPLVLQTDLYRELKESRDLMQQLADASPEGSLDRADYLGAKTQIEQRIRNEYCQKEEVFRDYVQHVLANRRAFLTYPREGRDRTYFIDALAKINDKNLIVWTYSNDKTKLVKAHEYNPAGWRRGDIWHVLHDNDHYSRVVPVNNPIALAEALAKENTSLQIELQSQQTRLKEKVNENLALFLIDLHEQRANSAFFDNPEKASSTEKANQLKIRWGTTYTTSPLTPQKKAAYYQSHLNSALKRKEVIKAKIKTRPTEPNAMEIRLASTHAGMREHVEKKREAVIAYNNALPIRQKELLQLKKEIPFYRECLQPLNVNPTNIEVADALLQLFLYYADLAESAELKSGDLSLLDSQREEARKAYEEASSEKAKFGEAFDQLENVLFKDIDFQVRVNRTRAKKRLEENLAKNLRLADISTFREDYNAAQTAVTRHYEEIHSTTPNAKYFNPDYLSADPFLIKDNIDEIYPNDISDETWAQTIPQQLYEGLLHMLVPEAERAYVSQNIHLLNHNDDYQNPANNLFLPGERGIRLGARGIDFADAAAIAGLFPGEGISKVDFIEAVKNLFGVLNRLRSYRNGDAMGDQKKLAQKRFQRIIDTLVNTARLEVSEDEDEALAVMKAKAKAALAFAQNHGRCPDGIIAGLTTMETGLFRDASFAEAEISNIFSGYVLEFCQKFARLGAGNFGYFDSEWVTNAPQFAMQRTFFSLPYKGSPREAFYALPGSVRGRKDGILSPTRLMTLFLKGGDVTDDVINGKTNTVRFEPFDVQKAINLVYEAYQRGLAKVKTGAILTYDNVIEFIDRDPYLSTLYQNFSKRITEENVPESKFFETQEVNVDHLSYLKVVFKKPFFEYVLEKLGYIINPRADAGVRAEEEELEEERVPVEEPVFERTLESFDDSELAEVVTEPRRGYPLDEVDRESFFESRFEEPFSTPLSIEPLEPFIDYELEEIVTTPPIVASVVVKPIDRTPAMPAVTKLANKVTKKAPFKAQPKKNATQQKSVRKTKIAASRHPKKPVVSKRGKSPLVKNRTERARTVALNSVKKTPSTGTQKRRSPTTSPLPKKSAQALRNPPKQGLVRTRGVQEKPHLKAGRSKPIIRKVRATASPRMKASVVLKRGKTRRVRARAR